MLFWLFSVMLKKNKKNPMVSRQAAEMGADAVLVVTPAYVKPSQKGLVKFYKTVADDGALPVVLYNVR